MSWNGQRSFLFGLWLVAVTAAGYLLINEEYFFGARSLPLASVTKAENDVRYRGDSDYRWITISDASYRKIFDGDKIYAGENSGATLDLGDGRIVVIGPETLIGFSMIQQKSGMTFIANLTRGSIEVRNGKSRRSSRRSRFPIIIRSDGKDYQVAPGDERRLVKDESGVKDVLPSKDSPELRHEATK